MSDSDNTFESTVSATNCDTGTMKVPVQAQREQGITIDDEVEVTLSDFDDEFIDSVSFTNKQVAGDQITVPASLMRKVGFEGGEKVTAKFEKVDSGLGDSHGALDEEAEEEETETTSVAELFG